MARSSQIYRIISVDNKKFIDVLKNVQTKNKKKYPYAQNIDTDNENNPSGNITIHYVDKFRGNVIETIFIEFDIEKQRCYIIGSATAREEIVKILNKLLDKNTNFIQVIKLHGRNVYVDMLKILTKIDPDHYIKTLKAVFDVYDGFKTPLDKHNVDVIQFGFTKFYCVSKHKKSFEYINNAIEIKIKFAIWTLGNFKRQKKDKNNNFKDPLKFDVTTDYTFRFYYTFPNENLLLVMKILDVDPDRYASLP